MGYTPDDCTQAEWNDIRRAIYKRDDYKCQVCGRKPDGEVHCDHIKPMSQGGSTTKSNLQTLCPECHNKKTKIDVGAPIDEPLSKSGSSNVFPKLPRLRWKQIYKPKESFIFGILLGLALGSSALIVQLFDHPVASALDPTIPIIVAISYVAYGVFAGGTGETYRDGIEAVFNSYLFVGCILVITLSIIFWTSDVYLAGAKFSTLDYIQGAALPVAINIYTPLAGVLGVRLSQNWS